MVDSDDPEPLVAENDGRDDSFPPESSQSFGDNFISTSDLDPSSSSHDQNIHRSSDLEDATRRYFPAGVNEAWPIFEEPVWKPAHKGVMPLAFKFRQGSKKRANIEGHYEGKIECYYHHHDYITPMPFSVKILVYPTQVLTNADIPQPSDRCQWIQF